MRMIRTARRLDRIEPFYVMECAKAAEVIARSPECDPARGGEPMMFLNIGEPDFTAAPLVRQAAERCLREGRTQYTQATGLPALRERIAGWYGTRFGVAVDPARIVVTAGASAALQLACLALFEAGDEVLMPDPSYPCNRHFVSAVGRHAAAAAGRAGARFQLDAASVAAHWSPATRGVLLASPSQPHRHLDRARGDGRHRAGRARTRRRHDRRRDLPRAELRRRLRPQRAGADGDDVISINSFSKYFGMTGWRLGWMVLPPALVAPVEKLAQNLYICAARSRSTPRWPASSRRRWPNTSAAAPSSAAGATASCRRSSGLGLKVPVPPDGAFYAWADCSAYSPGSWDFCFDMMRAPTWR